MLRNKYQAGFTNKQSSNASISLQQILRETTLRAQKKYSTADAYYVLHDIDSVIQNKKCKLKDILKDQEYNKVEQTIQKMYSLTDCYTNLQQLIEYYKYYTQTTILYLPKHFKIMHQNREKKKIFEYNRLKAVLNLSTSNSDKTQQQNKHYCTPVPSFHIKSHLNISSFRSSEESFLFYSLKDKLNLILGQNCYKTIDQIDKNYYFQKKKVFNKERLINIFHQNNRIGVKNQQNDNLQGKISKIKLNSKRKNSCEQINILRTKRNQFQHRRLTKKKFGSMDNLTHLRQQTPVKKAIVGNWITKIKQPNEHIASNKSKQVRKQNIKKNITGDIQVKQAINGVKQKIRIQKQSLRKKLTAFSSQSQNTTISKKSTITPFTQNSKFTTPKGNQVQFF